MFRLRAAMQPVRLRLTLWRGSRQDRASSLVRQRRESAFRFLDFQYEDYALHPEWAHQRRQLSDVKSYCAVPIKCTQCLKWR